MRSPFSPRALGVLVLLALLAAAFPPPLATAQQQVGEAQRSLIDFRIVALTATTGSADTYAEYGTFPDLGDWVTLRVEVQAFENPTSNTRVAFQGPFRVEVTRRGSGPPTEFPDGNCDTAAANIAATGFGKITRLRYIVPSTVTPDANGDRWLDLRVVINRACATDPIAGAGAYTAHAETGDDKADNEAHLILPVGARPDFALFGLYCPKDATCSSTNRVGGPGVTPGSFATGKTEADYTFTPPVVLCDNDPRQVPVARNSWDQACPPASLETQDALAPGDNLIYARIMVSSLQRAASEDPANWDNSTPTVSATGTTDPHAGHLYVPYPGVFQGAERPIMIPVRAELWRVIPSDITGETTYIFNGTLKLSDQRGDPLPPNCPHGSYTASQAAKDRQCAQWIHAQASATQQTPVHAYTPIWTTPLDVYWLGGQYEIRVWINSEEPATHDLYGCPAGGKPNANELVAAPDADCDNNHYTYSFQVTGPDLEIRYDPSDIQSPYQPDGKIEFDVVVRNVGVDPISFDRLPQTENAQTVRFFIDDTERGGVTRVQNSAVDGDGELDPGEEVEYHVALQMERCTTNPCSTKSVPPGTREAKVVVDHAQLIREMSETNNAATFDFRIVDTTAPALEAPRLFNQRGQENKGTPAEFRRGEPFTVRVNLTDTDHSITDVKLQVTNPQGQAWTCTGTGCDVLKRIAIAGDLQTFEVNVSGLPEVGDWRIKVRAADPSGQVGTSAERILKVIQFQKRAGFDYDDFDPGTTSGGLIPGNQADLEVFPSNGSKLPYQEALEYDVTPAWHLDDDARNETGFAPPWTSQGFRLVWDPPGPNSTTFWVENDHTLVIRENDGTRQQIGNATDPANFTRVDFSLAEDDGCLDDDCDRRVDDTKFGFPLAIAAKGIGQYNITLNVTDVGGQSRFYNTTFWIKDLLPWGNISLRNRTAAFPNGNVQEAQSLNTTGLAFGKTRSVTFRAIGHDDQGLAQSANSGVGEAFLVFKHQASPTTFDVVVNRSMGAPVGTCSRPATEEVCTFEEVLKVGRAVDGGHLNLSGKWNLSVVWKDKWGNFNNTSRHGSTRDQVFDRSSPPLVVYVNDSRPPEVKEFGTTHPEEEVGGNVTFYARVEDDLDVKVLLTAREGAQILFENVPLAGPDRFGNHTLNRTFAASRTVEYSFTVVDSNTQRVPVVTATKTVAIRDNLPPRVDVLVPHVPDHGYFAKAAPTLEFKVYDTAQGVSPTSLKLRVNGQDATSVERTPVEAGKGFLLRYVHDPSQPFAHGQRVNVTLEASDLSSPPKPMTLDLNFTVDALPPKSRIAAFDPRYVARDGDLWNVSMQTVFVPASSDEEDGLATGVKEIRYQFLRGGPGPVFVYNGTGFPMSQLPASQNVGNADYFVRVLGVDDVGNVEIGSVTNTLHVFLDQVPPELVRTKTRITGRLVNATFEDPASGVKSARMHFRYDAGAWSSLDMVRGADGTWTATVPANANAKNVCLYLEATDNVNNRKQFGDQESPPWCVPQGNRPPSIAITSPQNGAVVSSSVTLRWEASDPDGDPLTYKVYYRAANGRDELELTTLPTGTQSYVLNTRTLGPDGAYDIRVTASDTTFFEQATVRVQVQNAGGGVTPTEPPGEVVPGDSICYQVPVRRSGVSVVELDVFLDGEKVTTLPMADNGAGCDTRAGDGVYATTVTLEESGTYTFEVLVRYVQAGEIVDERIDGGSTVSRMSAGAVIGRYPLAFGAFAALAVAVFAVGGFAIARRWR